MENQHSSINIDGFVMRGDAVTVSNYFVSINRALKHLSTSDEPHLWVPFNGVDPEGDPVAQGVRIHLGSSVHYTLVGDSPTDRAIVTNEVNSTAPQKWVERWGLIPDGDGQDDA